MACDSPVSCKHPSWFYPGVNSFDGGRGFITWTTGRGIGGGSSGGVSGRPHTAASDVGDSRMDDTWMDDVGGSEFVGFHYKESFGH